MRTPIERVGVAFLIAAVPAVIVAPTANVALGAVAPGLEWPVTAHTVHVTLAALLGAALAAHRNPRWAGPIGSGLGLAATGVLAATTRLDHVPVLLAVLSGAAAWGLGAAASALPAHLDGLLGRRRAPALAWIVLALVTVVQTARLGTHMADPEAEWFVTTTQAFWAKHECAPAYFYAADLNRQGDPNVYAAEHYPGTNRDAESRATVEHMNIEDPYQYPPQFLAIPQLLLGITSDYRVIRPLWFSVQALGFLLVAWLVARRVGRGRDGAAGTATTALWLVPLVWISVPSMLNFQYGQFHVSAIALGVASLLAFERGRSVLGGGLLASAILAKGFPGLLLVPLVLQRRWRDVGSTCAWVAGLTVASWAVIGTEPFVAFFDYHLPRLQSGAAFAFEKAWPELKAALYAGNVSPYSLVKKLGELGLPVTEAAARSVHGAFGIALLGGAAIAARIRSSDRRILAGLALVNLASLTSPAAWGDYVPVGTLWLVTLLVGRGERGPVAAAFLAVAGGFSFLLPGVVPLGTFPAAVPSMVLSILGTVILVAFNGWVVARALRAPAAAVARHRPPTSELATVS